MLGIILTDLDCRDHEIAHYQNLYMKQSAWWDGIESVMSVCFVPNSDVCFTLDFRRVVLVLFIPLDLYWLNFDKTSTKKPLKDLRQLLAMKS